MKNKSAAAVFILIFLMAACVSAKDSVEQQSWPRPPQMANACLPKNEFIPFDRIPQDKKADIELTAYIKSMREYTTVVQGDWESHWYLIKCSIIKNTVGRWNNKELSFACFDTYPAPGSGIMLDKAIFPYFEGQVFRFWLQDSNGLPAIIGQEQLSPLVPYEKLNRPVFDFKDPNQKELYDKIIKAASSEINKGGLSLIHNGQDYYIVENAGWQNHIAKASYLMVDKKTFKASKISLPCFEPIKAELEIKNSQFKAGEPVFVEVWLENQTGLDITRPHFSPISSMIPLPEFVITRVPDGNEFSIPPGLYGDDWYQWYQPTGEAYSIGGFTLPVGKRICLLKGDLRLTILRARDHCQSTLDEKTLLEKPDNATTKKSYQEIVHFADDFLSGGTFDIYVRAYSVSEPVRITIEKDTR